MDEKFLFLRSSNWLDTSYFVVPVKGLHRSVFSDSNIYYTF